MFSRSRSSTESWTGAVTSSCVDRADYRLSKEIKDCPRFRRNSSRNPCYRNIAACTPTSKCRTTSPTSWSSSRSLHSDKIPSIFELTGFLPVQVDRRRMRYEILCLVCFLLSNAEYFCNKLIKINHLEIRLGGWLSEVETTIKWGKTRKFDQIS